MLDTKSIHIPPPGGVPDRAPRGSFKLSQLSETVQSAGGIPFFKLITLFKRWCLLPWIATLRNWHFFQVSSHLAVCLLSHCSTDTYSGQGYLGQALNSSRHCQDFILSAAEIKAPRKFYWLNQCVSKDGPQLKKREGGRQGLRIWVFTSLPKLANEYLCLSVGLFLRVWSPLSLLLTSVIVVLEKLCPENPWLSLILCCIYNLPIIGYFHNLNFIERLNIYLSCV